MCDVSALYRGRVNKETDREQVSASAIENRGWISKETL